MATENTVPIIIKHDKKEYTLKVPSHCSTSTSQKGNYKKQTYILLEDIRREFDKLEVVEVGKLKWKNWDLKRQANKSRRASCPFKRDIAEAKMTINQKEETAMETAVTGFLIPNNVSEYKLVLEARRFGDEDLWGVIKRSITFPTSEVVKQLSQEVKYFPNSSIDHIIEHQYWADIVNSANDEMIEHTWLQYSVMVPYNDYITAGALATLARYVNDPRNLKRVKADFNRSKGTQFSGIYLDEDGTIDLDLNYLDEEVKKYIIYHRDNTTQLIDEFAEYVERGWFQPITNDNYSVSNVDRIKDSPVFPIDMWWRVIRKLKNSPFYAGKGDLVSKKVLVNDCQRNLSYTRGKPFLEFESATAADRATWTELWSEQHVTEESAATAWSAESAEVSEGIASDKGNERKRKISDQYVCKRPKVESM